MLMEEAKAANVNVNAERPRWQGQDYVPALANEKAHHPSSAQTNIQGIEVGTDKERLMTLENVSSLVNSKIKDALQEAQRETATIVEKASASTVATILEAMKAAGVGVPITAAAGKKIDMKKDVSEKTKDKKVEKTETF